MAGLPPSKQMLKSGPGARGGARPEGAACPSCPPNPVFLGAQGTKDDTPTRRAQAPGAPGRPKAELGLGPISVRLPRPRFSLRQQSVDARVHVPGVLRTRLHLLGFGRRRGDNAHLRAEAGLASAPDGGLTLRDRAWGPQRSLAGYSP